MKGEAVRVRLSLAGEMMNSQIEAGTEAGEVNSQTEAGMEAGEMKAGEMKAGEMRVLVVVALVEVQPLSRRVLILTLLQTAEQRVPVWTTLAMGCSL